MSRRMLATLGVTVLCASAVGLAADEPSARRLGKTVTQVRDEAVQAVISTKYASNHLDREWTVLEICVVSSSSKPVAIAREDISLRAEDGTVMALPSQKAMAKGLPDVRNVLQTARVMTDPLTGYFPFADFEEKLRFFTIPGEDIVLDEVVVSKTRLARGWLFFRSPTGKWGGLYELVLKNKEILARIPFRLPAGEFPPKEGDPKSVPW
jgi:hypothetical protein